MIYAIVFLDLLGFGLVIPQLGVYAKLYGASGLAQGLLIASYSLMQFLCGPLFGRWSDRVGRRPVLLLSLCGSLAGYLLFAFSHSFAMLFVSRLIHGLGSANLATAQAYLGDVTPPERRAKAMGLIGAAFGLGFVFGPACGAILGPWGSHHWGPHGGNLAIGLLASSLSLLTLLLGAARLPESLPPDRRSGDAAPSSPFATASLDLCHQQPVLTRLLWVFFVATAGFSVLHAILSYHLIDSLRLDVATDTGAAQRFTGYLFTWIGLLAALVQGGLIGRLVQRCGESRLLLAGLVLLAGALALLPWTHSLGQLLLVATPLAIGNALCTATLPTLMTFHSPEPRRGEALGLLQAVGSLGRIVGPVAGGALYGLQRPSPFLLGAVLCAVAALVALGVTDRPALPPGSEVAL
ncbi:MAG: MFS transporter [Fimbriimonadaceae bacterium]|nr:MFS transporter [Fimbriimonadaceae bacterium]